MLSNNQDQAHKREWRHSPPIPAPISLGIKFKNITLLQQFHSKMTDIKQSCLMQLPRTSLNPPKNRERRKRLEN
uniref:Uncharacterized protein n=1 Tax=Gloeothece verrucosa (strain PCC 7822) TaxID=497965 RepID=E0ULT1_GLOV7|nr:hypothetical protein Cyan7822_6068 [Gloeothece verrucosa PCC 7822]